MSAYWIALALLVVALVFGSKDERIWFAPHAGYTWGAVLFLALYLGRQ